MTSDRFREGMAELGRWFKREISDMVAEAYWLTLKPLSDSEFASAVGLALANAKYMPTATELLEMAGGRQALAKDKAEVAWLSVVNTIQRHGAYASVSFEDGTIAATISSMGGWVEVCHREGDDFWIWAKKQFCETYASLMRVGVRGPQKLAGIIEQVNGAKGLLDKIPAAVPIAAGVVREEAKRIEAQNA